MNVAVRVLSILVATAASAAAQPYSVVELPCLPGTFRAFVSDINERLEIRWQPSVGALDYILEAGTSPGATNAFNGNIGAAPGLSVAAPPGRYYVRVRARNAIGIGPASAEVIIDVP